MMCAEIEAYEKVIEGLLAGLTQKNPKVSLLKYILTYYSIKENLIRTDPALILNPQRD